ncbi:MAG: alanine racemase [Proteobacteria bacterium]|nr:alanine racemase [Pseudomonadota bacterium]
MVGHLQRNKVKAVLPWVEVVHSLDSLRLAEELDLHAGRAGKVVQVLMQVNASGERSKEGVAVGAAVHLVEQIVSLPGLKLIGMMTMAPLSDKKDTAQRIFARMREIFEEIAEERMAGADFRQLSMGMSSDFEAAIAEGATIAVTARGGGRQGPCDGGGQPGRRQYRHHQGQGRIRQCRADPVAGAVSAGAGHIAHPAGRDGGAAGGPHHSRQRALGLRRRARQHGPPRAGAGARRAG